MFAFACSVTFQNDRQDCNPRICASVQVVLHSILSYYIQKRIKSDSKLFEIE